MERARLGAQQAGVHLLAYLPEAWFWANHSVTFSTWFPYLNYGDETTYHEGL